MALAALCLYLTPMSRFDTVPARRALIDRRAVADLLAAIPAGHNANGNPLHLDSVVYNMGGDMDRWHIQNMHFWNGVPVLLMFIGIIALSAYQERFWCRNLCPYGGLLALIAYLEQITWPVMALGYTIQKG